MFGIHVCFISDSELDRLFCVHILSDSTCSTSSNTCVLFSLSLLLLLIFLMHIQSNFFAALDDSDNEGKAPAPAVATKKTKAAPAPKPEVVEPSKVVERRP